MLHLLFTTGHTAPAGDVLVRHDLVRRSLDLTRMLRSLLPGAEVDGLLALVLLTHARRATRVDEEGRLLLLEQQDRSQWDREAIDEGLALTRHALQQGPPGRYALQAALAAVHAEALTWRRSATSRRWPPTRTWPPRVPTSCVGSAAPTRPGRRTRRPCCSPPTPWNATSSADGSPGSADLAGIGTNRVETGR